MVYDCMRHLYKEFFKNNETDFLKFIDAVIECNSGCLYLGDIFTDQRLEMA